MNPLKDEAVVVRLTEFSETSQIVTLFAAQHGLLRLIAKGARRSTKTRFSAGLDLLERGEVGFVPPHGDAQLGTLTDWVQRDTFAGVRRELLRLYGALYAVELVAALTEEADPHPELYAALVATLGALAGEGPASACLPAFQSDLLRAIGYAPHLTECVSCHRPIGAARVVFFSAGAGGLLCRDCEAHYVEKWRVPPELVTTTPQTGPPRAWFELLDYHLTHVAGRRFKTAADVAALLAKTPSGGL
ncbi:MAG TPA: DNA repair protein RecO [Phycisphaerae bacterium]|nr:DNA repair protein RecO [Phycisphaerae bacterium]HQL53117.1 DNA repair protein RecO [Phycisphaerae bacterium]